MVVSYATGREARFCVCLEQQVEMCAGGHWHDFSVFFRVAGFDFSEHELSRGDAQQVGCTYSYMLTPRCYSLEVERKKPRSYFSPRDTSHRRRS